jgi:hypothetical protein
MGGAVEEGEGAKDLRPVDARILAPLAVHTVGSQGSRTAAAMMGARTWRCAA